MFFFSYPEFCFAKFRHKKISPQKKHTHKCGMCVSDKRWGEVWCDDDKGAKSWIYCCQKMDKTKKDINLLKPNTPTPKAFNSSTAYPKRQARRAHEVGLIKFWEN